MKSYKNAHKFGPGFEPAMQHHVDFGGESRDRRGEGFSHRGRKYGHGCGQGQGFGHENIGDVDGYRNGPYGERFHHEDGRDADEFEARGGHRGRGRGRGRGHGDDPRFERHGGRPERPGRPGHHPGPHPEPPEHPGFGPHGMRGRARRGDVRLALLSLLAAEEATGYGLIKQIEEKSGGAWKTSPGSVYPNLSQLVDEGLISTSTDQQGRNKYAITEAGNQYLKEQEDRVSTLWQNTDTHKEEMGPLMEASRALKHTIKEVGRFGTPEKREKATEKIQALVEELQALLAE